MDPDRARDVIAEEWRAAVALLGGLDEADLARPTRCAGWDVRALVEHVLWGVSMETEALQRAVAHDPTPADGRTAPGLDAASAADLLEGARLGLVGAIDAALDPEAGDPGVVPLQGASVPLPVALEILAMEAGVHTDDLRAALTGTSTLSAEVVAATVSVLAPYLPAAAATAAAAPDRPVEVRLEGDEVAVVHRYDGEVWQLVDGGSEEVDALTVRGPDDALALLLLGRTDASDPRLELDGVTDLAEHLGRWLPGP